MNLIYVRYFKVISVFLQKYNIFRHIFRFIQYNKTMDGKDR